MKHTLRALVLGLIASMALVGPTSPAGAELAAKKAPAYTTLHVMHTSMQFSDSPAQKRHDARKIFRRAVQRNVSWVTGTEAGEKTLRDILKREGGKRGYRFHFWRDNWIAVDRDLIAPGSSWKTGHVFVAESWQTAGPGHDSGFPWVQFRTKDLGTISLATGHVPTKGRFKSQPNYKWGVKYGEKVGAWAKRHGQGKRLAFYDGDQNIPDDKMDTFRGKAAMTTTWDELRKWQNTGHGCIDVQASYNHDGRVKAKYVRALNDRRFFLYTDHFAVESGYRVRHLVS